MEDIVDGSQAHGPHPGQDGHGAAFPNAHGVVVATPEGMIHGMEGADNAAEGLRQGAAEEIRSLVGQ